jgi:hypothetical protein
VQYSKNKSNKRPKLFKTGGIIVGLFILIVAGFFGYSSLQSEPTIEQLVANELSFDTSVTDAEKETVSSTAAKQLIELNASVSVAIETAISAVEQDNIVDVYVPVTTFNSAKQSLTTEEIATLPEVVMPNGTDPIIKNALAAMLGISQNIIVSKDTAADELADGEVAFIPFRELDKSLKLLSFNGAYYLDDFTSGAVFRKVVFDSPLDGFSLDSIGTDETYKVNMTGVTALTRIMQRKLTQVGGDPLYFSAKIGTFLSDADLTHVSNEVSFKPNCGYSNTLFCSPPEFIETLKASGVDLVELTGNHNNDLGSMFNAETIELYESLGWATIGGGLNTTDAAKPFIADTKNSKVAFLAYNYPDSPNGGAIAGPESAGANSFDFDRIETEIASAKQSADFVIVNVQYWECYAYPDGYVEYPICDKPIGEQEAVFKKLVDLGANMVVGSSAHQPQTYELYKDAPIYYGLGNLYFDQTSWPGTERGIVLTHYFVDGILLQTKLTPTVFDSDLQTRIATADQADYLLRRLQAAR